MERCVQKISMVLTAGQVAGTTNYNFDAVDLSNADLLRFVLIINTIGTDAGDTFNLYIQARGASGIWGDRVAFPQYLGTATDAEVYEMILQKFGALSTSEEAREPQGSAGGSRLTAGTVVNGGFPGKYYESGINTLLNAWRAQLVGVDADGDATLNATLYVYADSAV